MTYWYARVAALLLSGAFLLTPRPAPAQGPIAIPLVPVAQAGAVVDQVTIETHGAVNKSMVWPYLSLRRGSVLEQSAVDRDYTNLVMLGGFNARLVFGPAIPVNSVALHWVVTSRWIRPTDHPLYADTPLSAPIQGIGFIVTSPPIDERGSNFSTYSQLSRRANLVRVLFTTPTKVDSSSGRESDFIFDTFGGRGVFRASEPEAINIYSWTAGTEALYLTRGTNGTQLEFGMRQLRSTTAESTGIVAPSIYPTYKSPAHNTVLVAGLAHACTVPSSQWYPPYCDMQYRFQVSNAPGWFGATSEYQSYSGDVARYIAVGSSTLALHAFAARTGGVVPDSFLVCGTSRAYPKGFCGTDAQTLTAEYRLDDARPYVFKFAFFTETSANRIRGGNQPWALPTFQWHPDSGIGIIYRNSARIDIAYGQAGGRLSFAIQGQTF